MPGNDDPEYYADLDGKGSLAEQLDRVLQASYFKRMINEAAADGKYVNAALAILNTWHVVVATNPSPTQATITFRFPVTREYLNPAGTLHGGQQASLFDIGSSFLVYLFRRPGFWSGRHTSRNLTVTYLRPAVLGDVILLECEVVHVSKRMSLLKAVMRREKDGALISTCEHTKFNIDADKEKL